MIEVPNMVMIGGNSRNAGKTTLACDIIGKISQHQSVSALKLTSIRAGEDEMHGNHNEDPFEGYSIMEEKNQYSSKDTSLMLQAGAEKVYYIRASDAFVEQAIRTFLHQFNVGQPIVCESRSLRDIVNPGLYLLMIREQAEGVKKNLSTYIKKADKVIYYNEDLAELKKTVTDISFNQNHFYFEAKQ